MNPSHPDAGFTLIEAVLLIVILAVVAVSISLGLGGLKTVRLDEAVNRVVVDLRYAQQLAVTSQSRHGLEIDSTAQYTIHRDVPPDTPINDPKDPGQTLVVNFDTADQGRLAGVRFASAAPFCGGAVIEFDSLGAPTDTGGTPLNCGPMDLTLAYSGDTRTITIEPATGRLSY